MDKKSIGFAIHGPVSIKTLNSIKNIRKFFPFSTISYGTWRAKNKQESLIFDEMKSINNFFLVKLVDPGQDEKQSQNAAGLINLRRMIYSINSSLDCINTEYCLKIRSDSIFINDKFLNCIKYCSRRNENSNFENRLVMVNLYARDPFKSHFLYHPSDVALLGKTQDIKKFFNTPINNLETKGKRISPEQYIWTSYLGIDFYKDDHLNIFNNTPLDLLRADISIIKNFHIVTPQELGIKLSERLYRKENNPLSVYSPKINSLYSKGRLFNVFYFFRFIKLLPVFYARYFYILILVFLKKLFLTIERYFT